MQMQRIRAVRQAIIAEVVERAVNPEAVAKLVTGTTAERIAIAGPGRRSAGAAKRIDVLLRPQHIEPDGATQIETSLQAVIDLRWWRIGRKIRRAGGETHQCAEHHNQRCKKNTHDTSP